MARIHKSGLFQIRGLFKAIYSFGELEWISINLSKSAVFSLQTLENNLTSP